MLTTRFSTFAYTLLRIVFGFLLACHGAQKLFGVLGGGAPMRHGMMGVAGVIEFFGGLLVLLGLFTIPAAFIASGEMAAAYFMVHAHMGFWLWPIKNQGELAVAYCFAMFFIAMNGAGWFSLDQVIFGGKKGG